MPNRTMQQKLLKIKIARRKKSMTSMKGGRDFYFAHVYNPTATVKDDGGDHVPASLGSRSRMAGGMGNNTDYLNKLFPGKPPLEALPPDKIMAIAMNGNPRAVVLQQLRQANWHTQSVDKFVFAYIEKSNRYKLKLFMGGSTYFFVQEYTSATFREIQRSLFYSSLDTALSANGYKQIRWVEPALRVPIPASS